MPLLVQFPTALQHVQASQNYNPQPLTWTCDLNGFVSILEQLTMAPVIRRRRIEGDGITGQ